MLRRLNILGLALLGLLLPFEMEAPWLRLGPVVLTNVEIALWAALFLAFLTWLVTGRPRPRIPATWTWTLVIFVAALFLSSLLAPEFRGNALKASLRSASGLGLALAAAMSVRRQRDVRWIAGGLVGGGLLAATIGLAEIVYDLDLDWLPLFRAVPTVAGRFPRLAGPFDYANQAAMFIEATLPLLLALAWHAWRARSRLLALLLGAAVLLYTQAIILTFSRAAIATLLLVNVALAALLWIRRRRQQRQQASLFAGVVAAILVLIGANVFFSPVFRLRLQSESDNDWYLARFEVPDAVSMNAGEERVVPITVTNEGLLTWRSGGLTSINVAARWVQPENERELAQRPRWPLAQPVAPGETLTMAVQLRAPRAAGDYHLVWDMVQENVVWFGAKTGRQASSAVTVLPAADDVVKARSGNNGTASERFETAWEYQAPIPGRLTLWTLAWRLWQERPLLGIGLDNFRLLYGRGLGYSAWNTSIHTNNWYVETVVSLGILGAFPFLIWLGLLALDIARVMRRPFGRLRAGSVATIWPAAIAAALLAYLVHGLLDYFLLFNATGLLFWMLVGLWLSVAHDPAAGSRARS